MSDQNNKVPNYVGVEKYDGAEEEIKQQNKDKTCDDSNLVTRFYIVSYEGFSNINDDDNQIWYGGTAIIKFTSTLILSKDLLRAAIIKRLGQHAKVKESRIISGEFIINNNYLSAFNNNNTHNIYIDCDKK